MSSTTKKYRIGSRGSKLALTQTNLVISHLTEKFNGTTEFEIVQIQTTGDKKQGTSGASFGDKKDWVYELEIALLRDEIDLAVHSAKDVPPNIESGTTILPILPREAPEDIFIGKKVNGRRVKFQELTPGSRIGTASLRRRACLLALGRGFEVEEFRGNVPTRVAKLDQSETLCGIVLAQAGVRRLNALEADEYEVLPQDVMLPAMNQGILAVQFREADRQLADILSSLSTTREKAIFTAERICTSTLGGSCNSAVAVHADVAEGTLKLRCWVLEQSGGEILKEVETGPLDAAEQIGIDLANRLIALGAKKYL